MAVPVASRQVGMSISFSLSMSIHLLIYLFLSLSLSLSLSLYLSIYYSISLSLQLLNFLYLVYSMSLYLYLYILPSLSSFYHCRSLSLFLPLQLSASLFACLSLSLSFSPFSNIFFSPFLSLHSMTNSLCKIYLPFYHKSFIGPSLCIFSSYSFTSLCPEHARILQRTSDHAIRNRIENVLLNFLSLSSFCCSFGSTNLQHQNLSLNKMSPA